MGNHYVTKELLNRIRDEIARRSNEIQDIRAMANKDRTGIDLYIARLKTLIESAKLKKDMAIDGLMEDGSPRYGADGKVVSAPLIEARMQERMSLIFRGEQKAFEAALELLEDTSSATASLVKERDELQLRLKEYEALERNDSPPPDDR